MGWKIVNAYIGESEGFSSVPSAPGNYAIYTCPITLRVEMEKKILRYIGTAQNMAIRLDKHEVIKVLKAVTNDYVFIKCNIIHDTVKRKDAEYRLIKRLRPGINYEPKKRRLTRHAVLCG